jgi:NAD(P)H-hydrate epimerase
MDPTPVLTRAAVRELDRRAIQEVGVPGLVLMENAGRACADTAEELLAGHAGPTLVLVGSGNNGGDGLVVARTLANRGRAVRVVFVGAHEKLERGTPDFDANLRLWRAQGGAVDVAASPGEIAELGSALAEAALVVDALFGTGLTRTLEEPYPRLFDLVRASATRVLAVDLPSGLDADTGQVLGAALRADVTVTLVAEKPGLRLGAGPELAGRVRVAEIGIPRFLIEEALASMG